jgi:pyridoxal phosphate enzyme (YggS family)
LQSNKCKQLVGACPNLYVVETVDSAKLARKLNAACAAVARTTPLNIMIQVNTSGEESKSGLTPLLSAAGAADAPLADVVRVVLTECPNLRLFGLMTIGRYGDTTADCFEALVASRDAIAPIVAEVSGVEEPLELSMGMSGDMELAVQLGSTSVRVGSAIFGAR